MDIFPFMLLGGYHGRYYSLLCSWEATLVGISPYMHLGGYPGGYMPGWVSQGVQWCICPGGYPRVYNGVVYIPGWVPQGVQRWYIPGWVSLGCTMVGMYGVGYPGGVQRWV